MVREDVRDLVQLTVLRAKRRSWEFDAIVRNEGVKWRLQDLRSDVLYVQASLVKYLTSQAVAMSFSRPTVVYVIPQHDLVLASQP